MLAEPVQTFQRSNLDGWAGGEYKSGGCHRLQTLRGGTICYHQNLTDFVARLEFKLPPGGNNGLAIRYLVRRSHLSGMCGCRCLITRRPPNWMRARITAPPTAWSPRGHQKAVGEWNEQEVTVQGSKIKVVLNGTTILDTDLREVREYMGGSPHPGKERYDGFFGFAGHGDPVSFRNIRIKALR